MFIVYGAGETGKKAVDFLGWPRVLCFASSFGSQDDVYDKKVVSYEDMLITAEKENAIIVVASSRYNVEMVKRLEADNVTKFFVYHEADPAEIWNEWPYFWLYGSKEYYSYKRVLSLYDINKYKRIAIYGDNFFLPYLISEISMQSGYDSIVGVIPSSTNNTIRNVGIPIVSLEEVWGEIDCLVVNKRRRETDVFDVIREKNPSFQIVHIYDIEKFITEFHHPEMKRFKNIHKGKRCFVVGNGPSLKVEDLDKLHEYGEICFGFNRIYRVYNQTEWRADYLAFVDCRMINICQKDINNLDGTIFISDVYHKVKNPRIDCAQYFHLNLEDYNYYHPTFSNELDIEAAWGATVVYDVGLQFAAYMGASEIYLIGCDCTDFRDVVDGKNHFIDNYIDEKERVEFKDVTLDWKRVFKAYETAEWYSRKNGFRIYNATRGGKLEVFERVDFDSLF